MQPPCSTAQLMTCVLSRDLENGDRVAYGLHADIGLGAALLARALHAPGLQLRHGLGISSLPPLAPPAWSETIEEPSKAQVAYLEAHEEMLRWGNPGGSQTFSSVFFIGGMQIDRFGSTNLIGIKSRSERPAVRGPGSIGTTSAAWFCSKYYIFCFHHDLRIFVPKVDFVSVPGTDRLRALGYPDKKPRLCITPLGVFDWDNEEGCLQVRTLHPGVSWEEVQSRTGFALRRPKRIACTTLPSAAERKYLETIDPTGRIKALDGSNCL